MNRRNGSPRPTYYTLRNIETLPQFAALDGDLRFAMKVVANVLPFRINNYVAEHLIDWDRVPDDPMYQLTFMHREMLSPEHFDRMAGALRNGHDPTELREIAGQIRRELNPHPAGQRSANVPFMDDEPVAGLQHKYRETCLVFPSGGQTCHAYCTYCFRWPQFVGLGDLKFATDESRRFQKYIRLHKELTDVLITGGDPLIMTTEKLATYVEPFLGPEFEHIRTIRLGTKSVAYWPYRFVSDADADDLLRLMERVARAGKHLAVMAHYNHPRELSTKPAREAVRRILATGAVLRSQSPVIRRVNDNPRVWAEIWTEQVQRNIIPYYMFVARDTGARDYFSVPLYECWEIFRKAYARVSGLKRTVRGPSMSCTPGKIAIEGVAEVYGEKVFVLTFLQARNPNWVKRPFFAKFDPEARWLDDLTPAFGEDRFFFERELHRYTRPAINRRLEPLLEISDE